MVVAITIFITTVKIIAIVRLSIDVEVRLKIAERGMYVGRDQGTGFSGRDTFQILIRNSQGDNKVLVVADHLNGKAK